MRLFLCLAPGALLLLTSGASAFILGIDLGSQFFKAAVVAPGKPFEVVHNQHSKRKTPTAVSYNEKVRAFGDDAVASASRNLQKTPMLFPLQLGRNFTGVAKDDLAYLPKEFYPYDLSISESGSLRFDMGDESYTVEELSAHLLNFLKALSAQAAEAKNPTEAVLTIPSQATYVQRRALLAAAKIAGLPRPQLLHETSAAALQRALDLNFNTSNETTEKNESTVLYYNMGARHVEACVVNYRAATHMNKPTVAMNVLGCDVSEELGGHFVDMTISQVMLKAFQAKHPKLAQGILSSGKSMKKLEKEASSLKHILSANKEGLFRVESLYEDTDFSKPVKREDLEGWCAALFAAVSGPIQRALEVAGVAAADIDEVELVGGAWRMPMIQSVIADHLLAARPAGAPILNLSQHLNGEEAMATGAAFYGANSSASFKTKRIYFTDITSHGYSLELTPLNASQPHEEGWAKSVELFPVGSKLRARKTVKLNVGFDVHAAVFEDGRPIVQWMISGIHEAATEKFSNLSTPLLTMKLDLDASGVVQMFTAQAIFDEPYTVEVKRKAPAANASANASADGAAEGGADVSSGAEGDASEKAADKAEGEASEKAEGEATEKAEGDKSAEGDAEAGSEAAAESDAEESKVASGEAAAEGTKTETKIKKRKVGLSVTEKFEGVFPRPMLPEEIQAAVERLRVVEEFDAEVRRIDVAKNALEAFIYESRDKINDDQFCLQVSTEDQRSQVSEACAAMEEWLYEDEAREANVTLLTAKLDSLKALVNPIRIRAYELEHRDELPPIIKQVKDYVNSTLDYVAKNMTWVEAKEREGVANLTVDFDTWYANVTEQQASRALTEDPAYTVHQVKMGLSKIQNEAQRLTKMRKIDPMPYSSDYSKYGGGGYDRYNDPKMKKMYEEMMKNFSRNGTNGSFWGNRSNFSDAEYMRSFYEHAASNFSGNGSGAGAGASDGANGEGAGADGGSAGDKTEL